MTKVKGMTGVLIFYQYLYYLFYGNFTKKKKNAFSSFNGGIWKIVIEWHCKIKA